MMTYRETPWQTCLSFALCGKWPNPEMLWRQATSRSRSNYVSKHLKSSNSSIETFELTYIIICIKIPDLPNPQLQMLNFRIGSPNTCLTLTRTSISFNSFVFIVLEMPFSLFTTHRNGEACTIRALMIFWHFPIPAWPGGGVKTLVPPIASHREPCDVWGQRTGSWVPRTMDLENTSRNRSRKHLQIGD